MLWEWPVAVFLVCYFHPGPWTRSFPSLTAWGRGEKRPRPCSAAPGGAGWEGLRVSGGGGCLLRKEAQSASRSCSHPWDPAAAHGGPPRPAGSSGANGRRRASRGGGAGPSSRRSGGLGCQRAAGPPHPRPCSSAYDARLRQKVAVKKLSRPFQSLIHARRTHRELRLLKHMKHENVSARGLPGGARGAALGRAALLTPLPARSLGCWTSSLPPPPSRTSAKCKRQPDARPGRRGRARS